MTREDEEKFAARIRSERSLVRITNEDLQCRDCVYRYADDVILGNTSRCAKFALKPNSVVLGKNCEHYEKEENQDMI